MNMNIIPDIRLVALGDRDGRRLIQQSRVSAPEDLSESQTVLEYILQRAPYIRPRCQRMMYSRAR